MTKLDELLTSAGNRAAIHEDLVTCVKDLIKLALAKGAYPGDSTIIQAQRVLQKEKETCT